MTKKKKFNPKEYSKQYNKSYYELHKEELLKYNKDYVTKNREKVAKVKHLWYLKKKKNINLNCSIYNEQNKTKIKVKRKERDKLITKQIIEIRQDRCDSIMDSYLNYLKYGEKERDDENERI